MKSLLLLLLLLPLYSGAQTIRSTADNDKVRSSPFVFNGGNPVQSNKALLIVDGVIQTADVTLGPIYGVNSKPPFDLNNEQIVSLTVLKGATAAALYGPKGEHGAVLVKTKPERNK